jgi:hypothetical protein
LSAAGLKEAHGVVIELVAAPLKQDVSSYSLEEDTVKYFLNVSHELSRFSSFFRLVSLEQDLSA